MIRTTARVFIVAAIVAFLSGAVAHARVPIPAETLAVVTVSGHTSTAVSIPTVKVGQEIPKTYAGSSIHNMPGFQFYVSQHYALQSDMGDAFSAHLLEIAELAYPHWVDLVGAEPPDPETRMYFVYASTAERMKQAISNDTGLGEPSSYGGGITLYANHSAYNYPSGSLLYHKRALTIHENLHLLQMVVYGTGGLEDFTYSGEQSVYDPVKRQLTVMVFDKAPTNNWTDVGLVPLQKEKPTFAAFLPTAWSVGGGPAVALTQFLWTDPDRYLKWQIWRDEYYLGHINAETVSPVTESIFGSLDALNVPWQAWLQARHNSFHYVDWGWEQEGNTLWSYGFPQHAAFSQTDIRYKPGEASFFDPYRMDYPTAPQSPLVGPVKRGGDNPTVGATIDFSRNVGNGIAGLGLGVVDSTYYAVMIQNEKTLSVFSQDITDTALVLPRRDLPLPAELIDAAKANGNVIGITVHIGPDSLGVTVRAGMSAGVKTAVYEIPIDVGQRARMLGQYMAVLAKNNYHGITPYIDDARIPSPDLTQSAPANFWRFADMDRLESLYEAAWRLGDNAPASLRSLKAEMLDAVQSNASSRSKASADYEARIRGILHDVQNSKADAQAKSLAQLDLVGIFVRNVATKLANPADAVTVSTTLINRLPEPVSFGVSYSQGKAPQPAPLLLVHYRPQTLVGVCKPNGLTVTLYYRIAWRGETLSLAVDQPVP